MVCCDSGLVIHVTHLRNMLFICTLIFQKLDVNLQGFFFFSFEKHKQNCSPSFFSCYQGSAVAPFHVSSDHSSEMRAIVLKHRLFSCHEGTIPASVSEMPLCHLSVLLCLLVS